MKYSFLFCVIFAVILGACTEGETDPVATNVPPTNVVENNPPSESSAAEAYPLPEAYPLTDSGYPVVVPTYDLPTEMVAVDPPASAETGTVTGVIKWDHGSGPEPIAEEILYLGGIVYQNGQPAMGSLDKQNAPVNQVSYAGQFIFEDVPPGEYTLMLDRIVSTFLLNDPDSGGAFIVEVRGGEITDLGELIYYDLPLSTDE